ncbi:hypothetical protein A3I53_04065 [Candidatus Curtissbacteria bacterium RIFCSPLOWO2_02_FULL_40_13b]|uniref:Uncharacterized protein n=3 Tax=Candidatus Curtissiibacteriota TaxID=1752717 RepID=A0A1F5HPE0_9BACT|nr:MAG: hypothetical protein A2693_00555 [Candidatus Curtissbacteria bacterium RIFCSPHIGHO2_01_FULL_40_12]OGE05374.1 MAG: hypothetical protein A3F45_00395 [Candidatus Curtissbacteria bacterium RIFCSPHIGHO2_12_FULL_41_17]OGE05940.1 MAG: hypothetical protein A3I53_04065 [Candidatus Curtissbacteria bacterium RIFCSPLOWO2_02_FULL_40_13b]
MVDQPPQTDQQIEAVWQDAISFLRRFRIEGDFTEALGRLRRLGWVPELKSLGDVLLIEEKKSGELPSRVIKFNGEGSNLHGQAFWNVDSDLREGDEPKPDRNIYEVTAVGLNDEGDLVIEDMENLDNEGFIVEKGLVVELSKPNAGVRVDEYMAPMPQL